MLRHTLLFVFVVSLLALSTRNSLTTIPSYTGTPATFPSFTGYLQVRTAPDDGHVWYWFFPSLNDKAKDPLIVWLAGGPGCSSMIALFTENGPYRAETSTNIIFNQNTWIQRANVLFIDQIIGTGLSYTKGQTPRNTTTVTRDIHTTLDEFFRLFPEYKLNDMYMAGDSYSGKFIPSFFQSINSTNSPFNFKGVLMGNPSFDPILQFSIYPDLGYASGIIDYRTRVEMNIMHNQCVKDIRAKNFTWAHNTSCTPIIFDRLVGTNGLSPFDTRELRATQNYFDVVPLYLNRPEVRTAIGANALAGNYVNCEDNVFTNFVPDMFQAIPTDTIPNMIKSIRVLMYNGQFDLRVGVLGTVEYLRYMNWTGRAVFNSMKQTLFYANDGVVGHFKSYLGLSHMTLYGASHVAPRTAGFATLAMMSRFVGPTQSLCENNLPNCLDRAYECPGNCSSHGTCMSKFTCGCLPGYTSEDCSVGTFDHDVKSEKTFTGTIVGKDLNIYRLRLSGVDTMLNVYVNLTRTNNVGTAYLFVSAHGADDIPSDNDIRNLVYTKMLEDNLGAVVNYGFKFVNTSADPRKVMVGKGMQLIRGAPNVLTIVVYNSDDFITKYRLHVRTEVGSGEIRLLGVFTTLCIFVALVVLAQVFMLVSGWKIVNEAKKSVLTERLVD